MVFSPNYREATVRLGSVCSNCNLIPVPPVRFPLELNCTVLFLMSRTLVVLPEGVILQSSERS